MRLLFQSGGRSGHALLVVDMQTDFISGSLPVPRAQQIIPIINTLTEMVPFDLKIFTLDWHPADHCSFLSNASIHVRDYHAGIQEFDDVILKSGRRQTMWPTHCVQDSLGAQIPSDVHVGEDCVRMYKGDRPEVDSYSAFWDNDRVQQTPLLSILAEHNIGSVYVCGLALDVCVSYTAIDAIDAGFTTFLISDASMPINPDLLDTQIKSLQEKNIHVIQSSEVADIIKKQ